MRIVADENIVAVKELFLQHGELQLLPGRSISAADVRDADVLLVRSITRVDRALLEGSRVRFVATATSGTDHLDLPYLNAAEICVADAAGSNANAVVEYCLGGIAELVGRKVFSLRGQCVAIIGFGHVGKGLYHRLRELGVACLVCDPYVEAQGREEGKFAHIPFCDLDTALRAPVVSLHTPLTHNGEHPTWHLLDEERLNRLAAGTLLINASRGGVVDNSALCQRLQRSNDLLTLLDVWENEPGISRDLLKFVTLGTPHIAGYSVEAKRSASERNYQSFREYFNLTAGAALSAAAERKLLLKVNLMDVHYPDTAAQEEHVLSECLRTAFPVAGIDQRLRSADQRSGAAVFDNIRKTLNSRREFSHYTLAKSLLDNGAISPAVATRLHTLGFNFSE